jgi:chondroitin 4-sulfotransferase 11
MPISHPHRTIFVHIPKTAGTSVEAVLGMHGAKDDIGIVPYFKQELDYEHLYGGPMQHMTAQGIRSALEDEGTFSSYFKFTIVRNPWDRLVSGLAWTEQKWVRGEELTVADFEQQVTDSHRLFAAAMQAGKPAALPQHLYPQCLFVLDPQQRMLVDFVARYESLAADWHVICSRLGVELELPRRMKSHHRNYREYYSAQTRRMVEEMYAPDIGLFGYQF